MGVLQDDFRHRSAEKTAVVTAHPKKKFNSIVALIQLNFDRRNRFMKKIVAIGFACVALLGANTAFAQATSATTASGSVTLIRPITITKDVGGDLNFGRIVTPTTGTGTVSMTSAADAVTAGSGAVALTGITTSRAKFTIDGEGGQQVNVTVPATFNMINGANTLTVTTASSLGASFTSGSLGSGFTQALTVGGSFSVPAGQATGVYTGTLNVSVAYN
jgi:hypothetical protein